MCRHADLPQHLQHRSACALARRRGATELAAVGTCVMLVLTSCGSDSDAVTVPSAEVTTAATDALVDSTPATDPPATDPPATDPAATVAPTTTEATADPIVVEGTTTEPEDQMGEGKAGPDGSVPYYNLKVCDGASSVRATPWAPT